METVPPRGLRRTMSLPFTSDSTTELLHFPTSGPQLPLLGHIGDVMLVWRKGNIGKKLSVCYGVVYYYNGAQTYEQFLQVSRLYRAVILLGLALCLTSASVSLVFMVVNNFFLLTSFF